MFKSFKVLFLLVFCFYGCRSFTQISVAVGNFENRSDWMYLDSWAKKVPDYLQHELSGNPDIVLVERHQLEGILNEQALSMTGLTDSSKAQEVGRLISAQYIITGTVDRDDPWFRISAKVINTSTGKVITEKVQSKDRSRLNEMVRLLGSNLSFQLSGQGTYQTSLKILQYPTRIFLGITLLSGITTGLVHHSYDQKRQDYQQTSRLRKMDESYDSANRLYKVRNVLIGITGTALIGTVYCWLHNLSPEEVMASQHLWMPYVYHQTGETIVGLQISF
ncbi:hypothetical protein JW835_16445 [bacterium]|nr:hypothetical protein [bacterium]